MGRSATLLKRIPDKEKAKIVYENIEALASAIIKSSQDVGDSKAISDILKKIDFGDLEDKPIEFFNYVWESLEVSLVSEQMKEWEKATTKLLLFFRKLEEIENIYISEPVAKFLKLVVRNYIWGFDFECVILCRSVMESTFRDTINLAKSIENGAIRRD